jgi:predicted ribosome quality control (RQC) complex YloA/Tae2 family protein
MKYSILQAWTEETSASGLMIARLELVKDGVLIRFEQGRQLLLVVFPGDSFPVWITDPGEAVQGEAIWKQLNGAELQFLDIDPQDRTIYLRLRKNDIYSGHQDYVLITEFCLPKPNVILAVQYDKLMVVDALNKYSLADNHQRQILPGQEYHPAQTSFLPDLEKISLPLRLETKTDQEPLICQTVNEYLKKYYTQVMIPRTKDEQQKIVGLQWKKELAKLSGKLKKQKLDLADAEKEEYWFVCAETLKHNLQNIKHGQTSLTAINYFDPSLADITIDLQPNLTPLQNLEYYLKKYHKSKRGREIIIENIKKTEQELSHIENILARIEQGELIITPGRQGLANLGKKLSLEEKLQRIRISDEFEIVIGRKASENDFITTQLAHPHDWWFHTRIYHGSHILLRCFRKTTPDETLIEACCSLAAWFSKARFSLNVPVDYTQIRYVRKPRKSAPGLVTYTKHQSAFVNPKDLRTVREELGK